jgi:hypothetical protein
VFDSVKGKKRNQHQILTLAHNPPLPHLARMGQITNREELEAWLKDMPHDWPATLALRTALLVFPIAVNVERYNGKASPVRLTLALFRTLSISEAARYIETINMNRSVSRAASSAIYFFDHASEGAFDAAAFDRTVFQTSNFDAAADDAIRATIYSAYTSDAIAFDRVREAGAAITLAADAAANAAADAGAIWQSVKRDVDFWESGNFTEDLLSQPLWQGPIPQWMAPEIAAMRKTLRNTPDGFGFWLDWCERRLAGKPTGFALPPNQDEEMSRRLVTQDDDWWNREPAEVNAEIQSWLDELTPDKEEAQLEIIRTRLAISIKPNFSTLESQNALTQAKKSVADARSAVHEMLTAGIGHNNPPEDKKIDLPVPSSATTDDFVRLERRLALLEEQLAKPKPQVANIAESTSLLKQDLDRLRPLSSEFTKGFAWTLGAGAATALLLQIDKLSGALGDLLRLLQLVLS